MSIGASTVIAARLLRGILIATFLTGCATTETDPVRVSMRDLWSNDRLQSHLEERQRVLRTVRASADQLAQDLSVRQQDLARLRADIDSTRAASAQQDADFAATQQQIRVTNERIAATQVKVQVLRAKIAKQEQELAAARAAATNGPASAAAIERSKEELAQLQSETMVLERAIDRILLVRAKHGLQTR